MYIIIFNYPKKSINTEYVKQEEIDKLGELDDMEDILEARGYNTSNIDWMEISKGGLYNLVIDTQKTLIGEPDEER